jgi:hypothetical protein
VIPKGSAKPVTIRYNQIERLIFSWRDTAADKSWEAWIMQYVEKKQCRESANIEADPLDD